MKKNLKVLGLISATLLTSGIMVSCGGSNSNPLWIVKEGFDESQEGSYGMLSKYSMP